MRSSEYEQYKKKRGLIDYTDMETYVSQLLRVGGRARHFAFGN
jgi:ATP-dependent exoDNAse (exonuclease V) beta subunit